MRDSCSDLTMGATEWRLSAHCDHAFGLDALSYAAPVPPKPRYAVCDPHDPRKGKLLPDPELGHIVLGEGATITQALKAASAPAGSFVWDRKEARVAYLVPAPNEPRASRRK
jgi:hypothetical protein